MPLLHEMETETSHMNGAAMEQVVMETKIFTKTKTNGTTSHMKGAAMEQAVMETMMEINIFTKTKTIGTPHKGSRDICVRDKLFRHNCK